MEFRAVEAVADTFVRENSQSIRDLAGLIADMCAGDERALAQLYEATVGKVYALACAILRSVEDTEEVVCETYAYVWANASRYDATRGNVLGWLLMLCRSRALDLLRQRKTSAAAVHVTDLGTLEVISDEKPEDLLSVIQERSHVHAALSQLSPERRRLVSLAFLQGLSHQEIAEATGLPLGTVKSHLRRSLIQLRGALEGR
jgi:RNA polymerase sigma-70 factor (ECF subfamily)